MSIRAAKTREANTERLQSLAARWHDQAWAPHVNRAEGRFGWAEHLKQVAEEHATQKAKLEA